MVVPAYPGCVLMLHNVIVVTKDVPGFLQSVLAKVFKLDGLYKLNRQSIESVDREINNCSGKWKVYAGKIKLKNK